MFRFGLTRRRTSSPAPRQDPPPTRTAYERAVDLAARGRHVEARELYRAAAADGDVQAMVAFGSRTLDHEGEQCLLRAIAAGHREATDAYVTWLLRQDRRRDAHDVLRRAVEQGRTDLIDLLRYVQPHLPPLQEAGRLMERGDFAAARGVLARAVEAGDTGLAGYLAYAEQRLAGIEKPRFSYPETSRAAKPAEVPDNDVPVWDEPDEPDATPAAIEAVYQVIRTWAAVESRVPPTVARERRDAWLARRTGIAVRSLAAARRTRNRLAHEETLVSQEEAESAVLTLDAALRRLEGGPTP